MAEQSDNFHLAKQEYDELLLEEKLMRKLFQKYFVEINTSLSEKLLRLQMTCNHSNTHDEEVPNHDAKRVESHTFCDDCGKLLKKTHEANGNKASS